jgi:hypothetical protein
MEEAEEAGEQTEGAPTEEGQRMVEVTGEWPKIVLTKCIWGDFTRMRRIILPFPGTGAEVVRHTGPPQTAQEERQRLLARGAVTPEALAAALEEIQEQERQRQAKETEEEKALPQQDGADHEEEEGAPEEPSPQTDGADHEEGQGPPPAGPRARMTGQGRERHWGIVTMGEGAGTIVHDHQGEEGGGKTPE